MRSPLAGRIKPQSQVPRLLARIFGRVVEQNERYTSRLWRNRLWYFEEA